MGIDFLLLGRLEAVRDGAQVELGAFRQRALLALLLANAGTVLSTDRILDELWGEAGGLDKQSSLWVYVSNLRAAIEPGRAKRSEGTVLLTRPPGYVLAVDREDTDVGRFERSVGEGRLLVDDDPARASEALRSGLAMWRGHAYEEFVYEAWAQTEISRLEELRLEATELRIDADLRLGLSRELVSELQSLVRQHPLRERLVMSLMLALYRSGRTAEALRAASALRQRLVGELGVEPSRALRDLEHDILTDDGHLLLQRSAPARSVRPRSGLTVRGYELREEIGRGAFGAVFRAYQPVVGREVAIKVIKSELADDPSFVRRFEAEAQLVAGLEHPHIVPLYDYWREPGAAYLVMRLVATGTLADALVGGALPSDRAAAVITQVASALAASHRNGVVHGDVRPENVLVDGDGFAYLSDFGVAIAGDGPSSAPLPYASPEQLTRRRRSTESDQYSLAVTAAVALTGLTGEYEQIRGALAPGPRAVLDRGAARDPARRYADVTTLARALADAVGADEAPMPEDADVENPYKGLRAFGAADAGDFFGRERLVERLIARLGCPGRRGRFVAVVGPSGSGKSSAVRAGLLPALAKDALPTSADWFRIEMTPAPHPFEELEAGLVRIASDPPHALLDVLLMPGGPRRAIEQILPGDDSRLLLVVDQFEELFTQVDPQTAHRFIDELVDLVTAPTNRVHVVITLRADFYDRPLGHRALGELVRDGTEVLTPMTAEELEIAITGPADKVGVAVDPRVVAEMVRETVDRSGALPLLQYALTELFDTRVGSTITYGEYRSSGGVSRALARRADSLVTGLGPEATETVRHLLLRLVSVDEEGSTVPTRRRALVSEIEELDQPGRVRRILDTFGRHRLLTFDRDPVSRAPTVEISHEALLTEWTTLRDWVEEARDDLRTHRQLLADMGAWTAAGRSSDYLMRAGRLDTIAAWAEQTTIRLHPDEERFLRASLALRDEERHARAEGKRRTAAAERRARRRSRQLALAAVAIIAIAALATFAWVQRQGARQAESELEANQEAQRLATLSVSSLPTDPELSLLLAEEAVRATAERGYAVPEAIDATHWAIQELGVQYDVAADTPTAARSGPGGVRGVWVLPVGELMALADLATERTLTDEECRRYVAPTGCAPGAAADGLEYLDGTDAYASAAPAQRAAVVVGVAAGIDAQNAEWQENLAALQEQYGVDVEFRAIPMNLTPLEAASQGFEADIYVVVGGSDFADFAESRRLLDVRAFLDEDQLVADYGPYLVSLSRIGDDGSWPSATGPIHGIHVVANSKALVWTREPEFTELGYSAATDWQSFLSLADTVAADGRAPFCLELMSTGADGWPATDWVEMVVLRTAGPDFYDSWIRHEVPFDHPVVVDAIRTVGEMVHGPRFLDTNPAALTLRGFGDALVEFTEQPPGCLMTPFPSFLPAVLGADGDLPVGSFAFPSFGAGHDEAVVGGGDIAVAVTDRPEVRAMMTAFASPDWGSGASQRQWPLLLPPNSRFDATTMANPEAAEIVTAIQDAIRADDLRFDASDAMPGEIGFGAFLDGMVRLFAEGSADNLDELSRDIARDIEGAWLELEASAD